MGVRDQGREFPDIIPCFKRCRREEGNVLTPYPYHRSFWLRSQGAVPENVGTGPAPKRDHWLEKNTPKNSEKHRKEGPRKNA